MDRQTRANQRSTAFWAAATVGVPVLLSASLLLALVLEMSLTAGGIEHHTSRLIAVAIVEALLIAGSVWGTTKGTDVLAGSAVAAGIIGVLVLAGGVLTR